MADRRGGKHHPRGADRPAWRKDDAIMDLIDIAEKARALAEVYPNQAKSLIDATELFRRSKSSPPIYKFRYETIARQRKLRQLELNWFKSCNSLHLTLIELAGACLQHLPELSPLTWVRVVPTWVPQNVTDWSPIVAELRLIEDRARAKAAKPSVAGVCATVEQTVVLANDARDKWLYDLCTKRVRGSLLTYPVVAKRLKTECAKKGWRIITDEKAIKNAANRWAERNRKSPVPRRQHGRKPTKPR